MRSRRLFFFFSSFWARRAHSLCKVACAALALHTRWRGRAGRLGLDHETAHDVCCLLIRLGVKATTSFRCLLPRFPPGRTALVSAHHAHLILLLERTGARIGSHLNIRCSCCFAALPTRETWWHMAVLANSIPSSLLPGMLSVLWADFGSSLDPIIRPEEVCA